jgi:hypothetical protein
MSTFAVFIYAPTQAQPDAPEASAAELAEHDAYAAELAAEGVMPVAHPLAPADRTVSLRARGRTDGPYLESAEAVVGFYVLEADDVEAAVAIASRNPALRQGGGVEVRPTLA